jgi:hypothetical protein
MFINMVVREVLCHKVTPHTTGLELKCMNKQTKIENDKRTRIVEVPLHHVAREPRPELRADGRGRRTAGEPGHVRRRDVHDRAREVAAVPDGRLETAILDPDAVFTHTHTHTK